MNFHEKIKHIETKDDFLEFLSFLSKDKKESAEQWENAEIEDYLRAIASWVEDMEGYYDNTDSKMPLDINWQFIATLFYVGKIYE